MTREIAAAMLATTLACCSSGSDTRVGATAIPIAESSPTPPDIREESIISIHYAGKWEFVTNRTDGRFQGDSARSFRAGDSITIVFVGHRLRIYGIRGPNGGSASVVVPGRARVGVNFYARHKQAHVTLYDSGPLTESIQTAGVVVTAPQPPRQRGYVNIDEIEALTQ